MLIHKQQTKLWMKLPTIPPRLAGKIVKYRPLWKPIILQDLKDSASSQAWKKNDIQYYHLAVRIRTCRAIFIFLLREKKRFRTVSKLTSGLSFPVFITYTSGTTLSQTVLVWKQSAMFSFETSNYPLNYKEICFEVIQGQTTEASDWKPAKQRFHLYFNSLWLFPTKCSDFASR